MWLTRFFDNMADVDAAKEEQVKIGRRTFFFMSAGVLLVPKVDIVAPSIALPSIVVDGKVFDVTLGVVFDEVKKTWSWADAAGMRELIRRVDTVELAKRPEVYQGPNGSMARLITTWKEKA